MSPRTKKLPPVINNLDDWSTIPLNSTFRTPEGHTYIRLLCGHFCNLQMTDDPKKKDLPDNWCYSGCHEQ